MMFSNHMKSPCDLSQNYDSKSVEVTEIELDKDGETESLIKPDRKKLVSTPLVVSYSKSDDQLTTTATSYEESKRAIEREKTLKRRRTIVSLILLSLINLVNYTDRYVLGSVLIDVEDYYSVNKTVSGLLHTLFLLSFTVAAPLVGYLGERYVRKHLIIGSCLVWLASILGSSFTGRGDFIVFSLLRCVFGAASAFYECVSLPIVSDLFKEEGDSRRRALVLFYLGPPLGVGLGFLFANTVRDLLVDDWRWTLRFTPGVVLLLTVLVIILFEEPERAKSNRSGVNAIGNSGLARTLFSNRTYILIVLASSFAVCTLVGFNWWAPSFITYMLASDFHTEEHIFSRKQLYSIVQTISGALGTLFPAELTSRLSRRKIPNIETYLLTGELFAASLALYLYLLLASTHPIVDVIFYALFTFFINSWRVLTAAILLEIVEPRYRVAANSALLFTLHLVGDSMAPLWIGALNDACYQSVSVDSIDNMFYCTQFSLYPLVIVAFFSSAFSLFSTLTIQTDKI